MESRTSFNIEVNPNVPRRLARLEELAGNLWYSWDRPTRALFSRLHTRLWNAVGHNPKAFLQRVDEDTSARSRRGSRCSSATSTRCCPPTTPTTTSRCAVTAPNGCGASDLVAYFCAEFGFHESFPIYSGGLGILAGDHCKTASDMRLPFVGVGLLYRQGYFPQTHRRRGQPARDVHAIPSSRPCRSKPVAALGRQRGARARRAARARGHLPRSGRRASAT